MAVMKPPVSILAVLVLPSLCLCVDMDLWTTYCPLTKFCTMDNSTYLEETKETGLEDTIAMADCCTGCSCEQDCWMTSNCCPDVEHFNGRHATFAPCTKLYVNNEFADRDFKSYSDNLPEYKVINFCPPLFEDRDVIDMCEERFGAITNLNDVVAVTDDKNRIFKNNFCALCHGANYTTSWDLMLHYCENDIDIEMEGLRGSEFHSTILEKCVLLSVPPEDLPQPVSIALRCGNSTISSCPDVNTTSEIADECLSGPDLPYTNGSTDVYKNVFCYLCQTNVTEEDVNVCQFASTEEEVNDTQWSSFRFGQNLDLFLGDKINQGNASLSKCKETEFFDPLKETCTRMYCPAHSVVSYGRCINIGPYFGSVHMRLLLFPLMNMDDPGADFLEPNWRDTRVYKEDFLSQFGLESCKCDSFHMEMMVGYSTKKCTALLIDMYLVTNDNCTFDHITQTARDEFSRYRNIVVPINETDVDFFGKMYFYSTQRESSPGQYDDFDITQYYTRLVMEWYSLSFTSIQFEYNFFLCPYMIIDIGQYNTIMAEVYTGDGKRNLTEITEQTRVHDGFYTLTENSITVCVDTYVRLYSNARLLTGYSRNLTSDEYHYGNTGKAPAVQFSYLVLIVNSLILFVW